MKWKKLHIIRLLIFYFCCHFQSENNTRNSSGYSLQMADKVADLKMIWFHFLKKINIRQTLHSPVIQIWFKCYSINFAEQALFTNFILLQSEDSDAIIVLKQVRDICHFNDKTFHLPLYVSYHIFPLTENPYFVRSMTPSITIIQSRTIMMYFDSDEVSDLVLVINIPHSLCFYSDIQ